MAKEAKTAAAAETAIKIASKLSAKDLGSAPEAYKKIKGTGKTFFMGTIFGIVTDAKMSPSKLDPTKFDYALLGSFETIPSDNEREIVQAGKVFIPEHLFGPIKTALGTEGNTHIPFAIEVYIEENDKSPTKYAWGFKAPLKSDQNVDPLASVRAMLAERKTPKQISG